MPSKKKKVPVSTSPPQLRTALPIQPSLLNSTQVSIPPPLIVDCASFFPVLDEVENYKPLQLQPPPPPPPFGVPDQQHSLPLTIDHASFFPVGNEVESYQPQQLQPLRPPPPTEVPNQLRALPRAPSPQSTYSYLFPSVFMNEVESYEPSRPPPRSVVPNQPRAIPRPPSPQLLPLPPQPPSGVPHGQVPKKKRIKHYTDSHRILLVGEGDFSFAACLAEVFGSAVNMVATSLDSRDSLKRLYGRAGANLEKLEGLGCTILHGVDAHSMSQNPVLRDMSFDRVVFNFPHVGFLSAEDSPFQIMLNRELVRGFLKSAKLMLAQGGEIHVTHKTSRPYTEWRIEELGEEEGLCLVNRAGFSVSDYPGYSNKRGGRPWCDWCFPVGKCSTFKFVVNPRSLLAVDVNSLCRSLDQDLSLYP